RGQMTTQGGGHEREISARRLAANRGNAQRSTGPRTMKGKRTSSQNRTEHGFYSPDLLIRWGPAKEDPKEFRALRRAFAEELQPETARERFVYKHLMHPPRKIRGFVTAVNATEQGAADAVKREVKARRRETVKALLQRTVSDPTKADQLRESAAGVRELR